MAKKPTSNKSTSSYKKNYLTPDLINKVSDVFNNAVFSQRTWDPEVVKKLTMDAWEQASEKLKTECTSAVVNDANEQIQKMFDCPVENWIDSVNETLNKYRRQSDVGLSRARIDLLRLWHDIAYGEKRKWDIPWLRHMTLGEKFMNFYEKDERYVLKGFTNQAILAYAVEHSDKDTDSIIIFKGDLEKLLLHDFVKDEDSKKTLDEQRKSHALSKLKGNPSVTSLFVPSMYDVWINQDGSPWRSSSGEKRPTPEEISSSGLKKGERVTFVSHPVWSMKEIEHLISDDAKSKLSELRSLRSMKSDFILKEEDKDLDLLIDSLIRQQVKEQSIVVTESGNEAFYRPLKDTIHVPTKEQFVNPIARYATWSHELAHSTKHLLGRKGLNTFGSMKYGIEELVAESTAHLMVKDLHEKITNIRGGELPQEWADYFEDYYENAKNYGAGWGTKFDFSKNFEQIQNADNTHKNLQILPTMMNDILNAMQLIKSGLYNDKELSFEIRKTALNENLSKDRKNDNGLEK